MLAVISFAIFAVLSVSHALQNNGVPNRQQQTRWRTQPSPMAATTYAYPQQRPFIMPLLQDNLQDWFQEFDDRTSSKDQDDDDDVLDYLPWFVLQHETAPCKNLIRKATRQYMYGDTRGDPKVNVKDALSVIEKEYKSSDVPVVIGSVTYSVERDTKHRNVARILSFAAYHRLPSQITALLFGDDDDNMEEHKRAFLKGGWPAVSFPIGLAIRLPRNRLIKKFDRYQPIPRRYLKSLNVRIAERCIKESARIQAPPRQLLTRQGFLDSLNKELSATTKPWELRGGKIFFPTKRHVFDFCRRQVDTASTFLQIMSSRRSTFLQTMSLRRSKFLQTMSLRLKQFSIRLKQYLRATLLSYGLLAFVWYNASLLWQWSRLSATFLLSSSALSSSIHRVGSVIGQVYLDLHIVAPVLVLALGLAPVAKHLLKTIQDRIGEPDDNKALLLVGSFLAVSHIGIGACILFVDAAILRTVLL
jgi:hypothetical protein